MVTEIESACLAIFVAICLCLRDITLRHQETKLFWHRILNRISKGKRKLYKKPLLAWMQKSSSHYLLPVEQYIHLDHGLSQDATVTKKYKIKI